MIFTDYVLRTFGLSKKYKDHFAVNEANMNIEKGDIYGFVGENGSGKTTIIRLITGLIFPSAGEFELFGVPNTSSKIITARKRLAQLSKRRLFTVICRLTITSKCKLQFSVLSATTML